MVRFGKVWTGRLWFGVVRIGAFRSAKVWRDMVPNGKAG